jgi:hypothetical protein
LVRGVLAARWVSGVYLFRDAHRWRRVLVGGVLVLAMGVALRGDARAAPLGVAERARGLIAELEAEPSVAELVRPALQRSKAALSQATAEAEPARAALAEETALEWAEVARDLVRASSAEASSDRLEQDASATQTEIARLRAAVEGAMARVGQARHELEQLEGAAPSPSGPTPASSSRGFATEPSATGQSSTKQSSGSVKAPAPGQPQRAVEPSTKPEHK